MRPGPSRSHEDDQRPERACGHRPSEDLRLAITVAIADNDSAEEKQPI